jgi:hypothetical protein
MTVLSKFYSIIFILVTVNTLAQTIDHVPLRSVGEIPNDFIIPTYQKVSDRIEENREAYLKLKTDYHKSLQTATPAQSILIRQKFNENPLHLNKQNELIFAENALYGVDDILHSGLVLYGDSLTQYVQKVANKLLVNRSDLQGKLRFYTLKINDVNAFSTDQGIVFVSMGLLSQLENEAQLAYILAHEIAHYTQKHVLESFVYSTTGRTNRSDFEGEIRDMSKFSKTAEFEADTLAIKWFNEAGYAPVNIESTFDLLLYSYLPFDEIQITEEYFNKGLCYIPPSQFPHENRPITAIEDYNDKDNSHPNIKRRKTLAGAQIDDYSEWGNAVNSFGDLEFNQIQKIARFETVRNNLYDNEYGKALYSIAILEQTHPNSLYLARCKAQAWLGLAQFKAGSKFNKTVDRKKTLEGESANMHLLLYGMDNKTITTMALRQIKDIVITNQEDEMLTLIWERMIKAAAKNEQFVLSEYSNETFSDVANAFYSKQKAQDSIKNFQSITPPKEEVKLSKYERIRNKKNAPIDPRIFDSTNYYKYLISDIHKSAEFLSLYNDYKIEVIQEQEEKDKLNNLTSRKRYQLEKLLQEEELSIGARDLVLVEPIVSKYRDGKIDHKQSELLATDYSVGAKKAADKLGMTVYRVDKSTLNRTSTPGYNERSCLMQLMSQLSGAENLDVFPVDYEFLEEVKENYGTSTVVFSFVQSSYDIELDNNVYWATLILPIGMIYFPSKLMNGTTTNLNLFVLDLDKGKVITGQSSTFNQPLSKNMLQGRIYDLLYQMKHKPTVR